MTPPVGRRQPRRESLEEMSETPSQRVSQKLIGKLVRIIETGDPRCGQVGRVETYLKTPNPFTHSKHVIKFDGSGDPVEILLQRTKVGVTIGVAYDVVDDDNANAANTRTPRSAAPTMTPPPLPPADDRPHTPLTPQSPAQLTEKRVKVRGHSGIAVVQHFDQRPWYKPWAHSTHQLRWTYGGEDAEAESEEPNKTVGQRQRCASVERREVKDVKLVLQRKKAGRTIGTGFEIVENFFDEVEFGHTRITEQNRGEESNWVCSGYTIRDHAGTLIGTFGDALGSTSKSSIYIVHRPGESKCVCKMVKLGAAPAVRQEKEKQLAAEVSIGFALGRSPYIVSILGLLLPKNSTAKSYLLLRDLADEGPLSAVMGSSDTKSNYYAGKLYDPEGQTKWPLTSLVLQIYLGLDHIHARGIIHQNFKAENLMLCTNGLAKVADFGKCWCCGRAARPQSPMA